MQSNRMNFIYCADVNIPQPAGVSRLNSFSGTHNSQIDVQTYLTARFITIETVEVNSSLNRPSLSSNSEFKFCFWRLRYHCQRGANYPSGLCFRIRVSFPKRVWPFAFHMVIDGCSECICTFFFVFANIRNFFRVFTDMKFLMFNKCFFLLCIFICFL